MKTTTTQLSILLAYNTIVCGMFLLTIYEMNLSMWWMLMALCFGLIPTDDPKDKKEVKT